MLQSRNEAGEWREWLRQQLEAPLAGHVVDVELPPGELVVYADSAGWSSRLRYALVALEGAIGAREQPLRRVRIRIRPPGRV